MGKHAAMQWRVADLYGTPREAVEGLLHHAHLESPMLEPNAGGGSSRRCAGGKCKYERQTYDALHRCTPDE